MICNENFESYHKLSTHIRKHKVVSKDYYDKFLKKEGEGVCKSCGNPTLFYYLSNGYNSFCSLKCSNNSNDVKKKKERTCMKNSDVLHPSKNTKVQEEKRRKRPDVSEMNRQLWKESRDKIQKRLFNKKAMARRKKTMQEAWKNLEIRKRYLDGRKNSEKVKKSRIEHSKRMKNGLASYISSCNKNPSQPQVELFRKTQKLCPYPILNYPEDNFSIDIAIPQLSLAIEYDGSYWHQDKNSDFKRQQEIEKNGWIFLRYTDYIPDENELRTSINNIIGRDNLAEIPKDL